STVLASGAVATSVTPVSNSVPRLSQYVIALFSSLTNRSATSTAQSSVSRTISGAAGAKSFQVICATLQSRQLRLAHLLDQLLQSRRHHLDQRRRPNAPEQNRQREHAEDHVLPAIQVLECRHLRIRNLTVQDAFDHPQRVSRARHQDGCREKCKPDVRLETGEDDQELTDKPGGSRQANVRRSAERRVGKDRAAL